MAKLADSKEQCDEKLAESVEGETLEHNELVAGPEQASSVSATKQFELAVPVSPVALRLVRVSDLSSSAHRAGVSVQEYVSLKQVEQ